MNDDMCEITSVIEENTGLYLHFITQDDGIQEHEMGNNSGNMPLKGFVECKQ